MLAAQGKNSQHRVPMMTCVPESWSNWNFDITGTSADPARITLEGITDYGTILLGGDEFEVKKQGLLSRTWELKAGKVGATAEKSVGISRIGWEPSFEDQGGDFSITLQTQAPSSLKYKILISSNIVGSIA